MFKTASVWVIHYIAIKFLESLTLRNISRCSYTPEPFASLGGYQSCKNIHYSTVFVVIADVILLFAQAFSNLILEPVHLFSGSARRWMGKILGSPPVLGRTVKNGWWWSWDVPGVEL